MRSAPFAMAAALLVGAAYPARAQDGDRLPTFRLTTTAGESASSAAMIRPGRWLILYVPAECGGCGSLLQLAGGEEHPRVAQRTAIVVLGASGSDVLLAAAMFPNLADASWYADPAGASAAALGLGTEPAIVGLSGDTIEWRVSGILGSSDDVRSIIASWTER